MPGKSSGPQPNAADFDADDDAPPAPRSAFSERELEVAWEIAAALKRQRPNSFVQGQPDSDDVSVDGRFDLRLLARTLLKKIGTA